MTIFVCLVVLIIADIAFTILGGIFDKLAADELQKTRKSLDLYRDRLLRYHNALDEYSDVLDRKKALADQIQIQIRRDNDQS